jgi:hypothetical protein
MSSLKIKTPERRVTILNVIVTYAIIMLLFILWVATAPSYVQNHPHVLFALRYVMVGFIVVLVLCAIHSHQRS